MGGLESSLGLTTNIPGVTLSEFLEGTRGFYTATAVSDTEGVYIVTPTYNGVALGATTRTLDGYEGDQHAGSNALQN
jgi:hypothetical protein